MFRVILVVVLLAIHPSQANRWSILSDDNGHYEVVNLDSKIEIPQSRLKESEVFFYYSSQVQTTPVKLRVGEGALLNSTDFKNDRPTRIIVHGWHNDNTSLVNHLVRDAYLAREDCNLLVTDWSAAASGLYTIARASVHTVGEIVAKLVIELGIDPLKLSLIGHSLGAHASGIAGSLLSTNGGHRPALIVGLDPALPLFELTEEGGRLDAKDADRVEVIHTSAGKLGFRKTLGHSDFYPGHGGNSQPGCGEDLFGACAHGRAYMYFAESILSRFTATQCDTYEHYTNNTCASNPRAHMGGLNIDLTANGTYYLHVNSKEPYSLG